jgi:nucleotide-binding universal stress UspA family protein
MKGPNIVLLTDFSPLSKVAMNFAVKMAANLNAEFTILNIVRLEGVPKANLKLRQIEKNIAEISEEEGAKLVKEITSSIKGEYSIKYKAIRARTVAEMVRRYVDKHKTNLVVMGLQGASALKKARLGGTTVSVIDECKVPVMAIPEFAKFKNLEHIVYASDLKNVQKELDTIVEFARVFGSSVHMIHVAPIMDKKLDAARNSVEEMIAKIGYGKIDFQFILDDDITTAIDGYIKKTKADLLTTFTHKLSLEEKLFGRSVTRKLAYQGTIPLLAVKRK